jgi:hypothetical protein
VKVRWLSLLLCQRSCAGTLPEQYGADLLLMPAPTFRFSEFLSGDNVKKVQIDRKLKHKGDSATQGG